MCNQLRSLEITPPPLLQNPSKQGGVIFKPPKYPKKIWENTKNLKKYPKNFFACGGLKTSFLNVLEHFKKTKFTDFSHTSRGAWFVNHLSNGRSAFLRPQADSKHVSQRACVVNHFTNGRSAFLRSQNGLKHDSRRACFTNHFANGRSAFLRPQNDSKHTNRRACFVNQFANGRSELLRPQNAQEPCQSARMPCKSIWMWAYGIRTFLSIRNTYALLWARRRRKIFVVFGCSYAFFPYKNMIF